MEKPKTAEEMLNEQVPSCYPDIVVLMQAYARQALEAYRHEVMDGLEYEDANRIQQINIDDYLK